MQIVKTQHFLGGVAFEDTGDGAAGDWQVQGQHRRTREDGSVAKWDARNYVRHHYRKDGEGKWKLDGIQPFRPLFMDGRLEDVIGKF